MITDRTAIREEFLEQLPGWYRSTMANQAETEIMRASVRWHQDLIDEFAAKLEALRVENSQANAEWVAEWDRRIETIMRLQELAISRSEELAIQLDTQAM
jgi:hypothetical protein